MVKNIPRRKQRNILGREGMYYLLLAAEYGIGEIQITGRQTITNLIHHFGCKIEDCLPPSSAAFAAASFASSL